MAKIATARRVGSRFSPDSYPVLTLERTIYQDGRLVHLGCAMMK